MSRSHANVTSERQVGFNNHSLPVLSAASFTVDCVPCYIELTAHRLDEMTNHVAINRNAAGLVLVPIRLCFAAKAAAHQGHPRDIYRALIFFAIEICL